jgi:hypothetical protein
MPLPNVFFYSAGGGTNALLAPVVCLVVLFTVFSSTFAVYYFLPHF